MSIEFTCPKCGHQSLIDEENVGKSGPCRACGEIVMIRAAGEPSPGEETTKRKRGKGCHIGIGVVLLLLVLCSGLLTYAVPRAREAARVMQCNNNLKSLACALHNYHDVHREFPPAVVGDAEAGTYHSWRVAALPFIAQQGFYEQYCFDEPWNSDHNLQLASQYSPRSVFYDESSGPNYYLTCPSSEPQYKTIKGHKIACTNYVMVTGPGTIGEGTDYEGITDGTSNTILLIEVTGDDLPAWTEPVDLSIDDLLKYGVNNDQAPMCAGSNHPGGFQIALADGSVRFLPETIDVETLRKMATRNGGEELLPEDFHQKD